MLDVKLSSDEYEDPNNINMETSPSNRGSNEGNFMFESNPDVEIIILSMVK